MHCTTAICLALLLLVRAAAAQADAPALMHDLVIRFDHATRSFTGRDHIELDPRDTGELPAFSIDPRWEVASLAFDGRPATPRAYVSTGRISVPHRTRTLDIQYGGEIDDSQWPYIVWLPGDGWYPETENRLVRFELELDMPASWHGLTQGVPVEGGDGRRRWVQQDPQLGVYLVAGPWWSRSKRTGAYRAGVMLLQQDEALANRYLDAALDHLERYSAALGAYPYPGFTLVENRRQTGWGMPGFTLLGSKVIRLPFILATSFPHEILHNWWGNGVFVKRDEGNWSEGLTTYLSDYLARERRGEGRQYRLDTLIAWDDFAARESDFPLSEFWGRHDRATQAVGYGKGMFLFHMLRRELGDATFLAGLRRFYAGYRFRYAGFDDIRSTFERECACRLSWFFTQWLTREGAPTLRLLRAQPVVTDGAHGLTVELGQDGDVPWRLKVPVRVTDSAGNVVTHGIPLESASTSIHFELDAPAARVQVDPEIDLFRHLDAGEKPTTFSRVFAAGHAIVVPADASFAGVAASVARLYPGWRTAPGVADSQAEVVVLIGRDHAIAREWLSGHPDRYRIDDSGTEIAGKPYPLGEQGVAALVDTVEAGDTTRTVLWIAARREQGLVDLLRRLSHYGRFSYAVFDTAGTRASASGQWRSRAQTLARVFDETVPAPAVPARPPLF